MLKFMNKYIGHVTFFKTIMFFRVMCGFYNDISKHRVVKIFARIHCVLLFVFFIYQLRYLNGVALVLKIIYFIVVFEFIIKSAISFYTADRYLYNFESDIIIIDRVMGWKSNDLRGSLVLIAAACLKLSRFIILALKDNRLMSFDFGRLLLWHLILVHSMTNSIVFELLWKRLRYIRQAIVSERENTLNQRRKFRLIKKLSFIYKNLLMSADSTMTIVKFTILFGVVIKFIKTTMFIQDVVLTAVKTNNTIEIFGYVSEVIIGLIIYCALLFFAELTLNEFDQIKGELGFEVLLCSDESLRKLLYEVIDFMETRPPEYTILRIIPLKLKLFVGLIGACATYIIMLLQFQI